LPRGLTGDGIGNLYVTDGHAIRKVIIATATVSTLAGSATEFGNTDGIAASARFHNPHGITMTDSDTLYVADRDNSTVRRVNSAGSVSTIAGTAEAPG